MAAGLSIARESLDAFRAEFAREVDRCAHLIDDSDTLRWNGAAITQAQLATLLRQTLTMPLEPELQFQPTANASYDASARTLATIKASGVTRFGFVGNERYRQFAAR